MIGPRICGRALAALAAAAVSIVFVDVVPASEAGAGTRTPEPTATYPTSGGAHSPSTTRYPAPERHHGGHGEATGTSPESGATYPESGATEPESAANEPESAANEPESTYPEWHPPDPTYPESTPSPEPTSPEWTSPEWTSPETSTTSPEPSPESASPFPTGASPESTATTSPQWAVTYPEPTATLTFQSVRCDSWSLVPANTTVSPELDDTGGRFVEWGPSPVTGPVAPYTAETLPAGCEFIDGVTVRASAELNGYVLVPRYGRYAPFGQEDGVATTVLGRTAGERGELIVAAASLSPAQRDGLLSTADGGGLWVSAGLDGAAGDGAVLDFANLRCHYDATNSDDLEVIRITAADHDASCVLFAVGSPRDRATVPISPNPAPSGPPATPVTPVAPESARPPPTFGNLPVPGGPSNPPTQVLVQAPPAVTPVPVPVPGIAPAPDGGPAVVTPGTGAPPAMIQPEAQGVPGDTGTEPPTTGPSTTTSQSSPPPGQGQGALPEGVGPVFDPGPGSPLAPPAAVIPVPVPVLPPPTTVSIVVGVGGVTRGTPTDRPGATRSPWTRPLIVDLDCGPQFHQRVEIDVGQVPGFQQQSGALTLAPSAQPCDVSMVDDGVDAELRESGMVSLRVEGIQIARGQALRVRPSTGADKQVRVDVTFEPVPVRQAASLVTSPVAGSDVDGDQPLPWTLTAGLFGLFAVGLAAAATCSRRALTRH